MADAATTMAEDAPRFAPVSKNYGRYALTLLVLIYTVNFLDRQILSSIGDSIKADLHLTDSQMGALGGIFFAALYTILGIPIARLADKKNRPWIMAISLAIWSGFTVLSAAAKNYTVLALARAGVSVGEAGCSPTAHSLLADYFPKERRATALAIYSMGISIGTLLGFALGGFVAERWGWRTAFLVAGLPGLFFAVVAIFTLNEPRSQLTKDAQRLANASSHISLLAVFSALEKRPTFWLFALGGAITSFVSYAHGQFLTPFFLRNHGPELASLATQFHLPPKAGQPPLFFTSLALGLSAGFGGAFGSWLGGFLADRLGVKDIRNYALFPILVPFLSIPILWYVATTDHLMLAFWLMLIPNIGVGAWWGPVYGGVQGLVPPAMRASTAAVLLFVINMIGLGGGPTAFGMGIDFATNHYLAGSGQTVESCRAAAGAVKATCAAASAEGIKAALIGSTFFIPLAMICFFLSRWTIKREFDNALAVPANLMSTGKLSFYMFIAGAMPGAALFNASRMFFKEPPPLMWLDGLGVGGFIGIVVAVVIAAKDRPKTA